MPKQPKEITTWWETATFHLLAIAFDNAEQTPPDCLPAFVFAFCGLESYINDIHYAHFAHSMATSALTQWRRQHLELRLAGVHRQTIPPRRLRSLRELREFRHSVLHPEPIVVRETAIRIYPDVTVGNRDLIVARKHFLETRYRCTQLPGDPIDFDEDHLATALLVILREFMLLHRRYPKWPLLPQLRGLSIGEWYRKVLDRYDGPYRADFRKLKA